MVNVVNFYFWHRGVSSKNKSHSCRETGALSVRHNQEKSRLA